MIIPVHRDDNAQESTDHRHVVFRISPGALSVPDDASGSRVAEASHPRRAWTRTKMVTTANACAPCPHPRPPRRCRLRTPRPREGSHRCPCPPQSMRRCPTPGRFRGCRPRSVARRRAAPLRADPRWCRWCDGTSAGRRSAPRCPTDRPPRCRRAPRPHTPYRNASVRTMSGCTPVTSCVASGGNFIASARRCTKAGCTAMPSTVKLPSRAGSTAPSAIDLVSLPMEPGASRKSRRVTVCIAVVSPDRDTGKNAARSQRPRVEQSGGSCGGRKRFFVNGVFV